MTARSDPSSRFMIRNTVAACHVPPLEVDTSSSLTRGSALLSNILVIFRKNTGINDYRFSFDRGAIGTRVLLPHRFSPPRARFHPKHASRRRLRRIPSGYPVEITPDANIGARHAKIEFVPIMLTKGDMTYTNQAPDSFLRGADGRGERNNLPVLLRWNMLWPTARALFCLHLPSPCSIFFRDVRQR